MHLTMPEELLLLMLDDETGRLQEQAAPSGDYALAGAVLAELVLAGRIAVQASRLQLVDRTRTGDGLQDRVLGQLAAAPQATDTRQWIEALGTDAGSYREELFGRLVAKGILKRVKGHFLWVFPERRYPLVSAREEREVKARLLGVLFGDTPPDQRDALLIGLCGAAGLFSLILAPHELEGVQPRINELTELEPLNRALADAIREIYARIARSAPMI